MDMLSAVTWVKDAIDSERDLLTGNIVGTQIYLKNREYSRIDNTICIDILI